MWSIKDLTVHKFSCVNSMLSCDVIYATGLTIPSALCCIYCSVFIAPWGRERRSG